jgi:hypothetical protein
LLELDRLIEALPRGATATSQGYLTLAGGADGSNQPPRVGVTDLKHARYRLIFWSVARFVGPETITTSSQKGSVRLQRFTAFDQAALAAEDAPFFAPEDASFMDCK